MKKTSCPKCTGSKLESTDPKSSYICVLFIRTSLLKLQCGGRQREREDDDRGKQGVNKHSTGCKRQPKLVYISGGKMKVKGEAPLISFCSSLDKCCMYRCICDKNKHTFTLECKQFRGTRSREEHMVSYRCFYIQ